MKLHYKIIIFLIPFLLVKTTLSQENDSLKQVNSAYQQILNSNNLALNLLFYKHLEDVLVNDLGPYGSNNYYSTTRNILNRNLFYTSYLKRELFSLQGIKPFTNLTYINASRKEQLFSVSHIQQFGKLMSLEFEFKKISSPGEYINQEANYTSFKSNFSYRNKKNSYSLLFKADIDRHRNEENGGLDSASVQDFQNSVINDKQNFQVNLSSSDVAIKKYSYDLYQRLRIIDFKEDSLDRKSIYLGMLNKYSSNERVFNDNDPLSSVYDTIFTDSISSIDSIYQNKFVTDLSLGYSIKDLEFEIFSSLEWVHYFQTDEIDSSYNNFYSGFKTKYKYRNTTNDFIFKYGLSGYRKNDLISELNVNFVKNDIGLLFNVGYLKTEPNLNFVRYSSNHFRWNNLNLNKQTEVYFNAKLNIKKWKLTIAADNKLLNNFLYFDESSQATQSDKKDAISTFSATKDYGFKNFHFKTALKYQITSDEVLLPLPDLIARQLLYYENSLFKKVLKFQIGFGVSYTTNYYGYAYSAALTEFNVQNSVELGNYPNVDVFINMHLKRAQLFLKYEHINDNVNLDRSFAIPNYPLLGRSFKFGLSWNLFD